MTNKPSLNTGGNLVQGLAAVALFAVLAIVFVTASFPEPEGFADGVSVVGSIGYSMFNLDGGSGTVAGEGMLAVFETMGIVLVAALVGGVMLALRDEGRGPLGAGSESGVATDGGRPTDEFESAEEGEA